MTIGTISIITGVLLLAFFKLFFKEGAGVDQDEEPHGVDNNGVPADGASDDPGLPHLPGNSYHYSWSANHSEQE